MVTLKNVAKPPDYKCVEKHLAIAMF